MKQQEMKDGQWVTLKQQHYNPEGQIQWEKDGKNNQTSLLKTEYYKYDNCGNVDYQKDRKEQVISYSYDKMNRPLTKTAKDKNGNIEETITYNYSRLYSENILEITDNRGLVQYLYYPNGKLKKETQPDGKNISYEYDNNGNRKK
ncbi:MAG: hypothetical protein AAGU27_22160 [Dehalobacterium sp.]